MQKDALKIIEQVLQNFDKFEDKTDMNSFVRYQLQAYKVCSDNNELKKTTADICNTIDLIDAEFQRLQKFKKGGKSRESWFETKLEDIVERLPEKDREVFIREVKTSLVKAEHDMLESDHKHLSLSNPLISEKFADINKKAIVKNLQEDIRNNTLLKYLTSQELMDLKIYDGFHELNPIKIFFNRSMDHPEDKEITKAIATATIIAKKHGLIKSFDKISTEDISIMTDMGINGAKIAYKVGTGEMEGVDAINYIVDRATSTLSAKLKKVAPYLGASIGTTVGTAIGSIFGPIPAYIGAEVCGVAGYYAGELAGPLIERGSQKIGDTVKKLTGETWEAGKRAVVSIKSKVANFFE